jgi:uncharacterized protein YggE
MKTFVLALLGVLVAALWAPTRAEERQALAPSITVVGSGRAAARPDMAEVHLGVVSEAPTAAKALKDNNEAMERLFATLDRRGVPRKDVQTTNFGVAPQYKRAPHGEQLPGIVSYRVSNEVRVKVRKLDSLGQVLDEVVQQGANHVQGVSFAVAEAGPLLDEARRNAMADARRKAELYAGEAGVGLGRVLLIQEAAPHLPGPMALGLARAGAAAVPVAEGEQEFGASITVTYAIGTTTSVEGGRKHGGR